jgi:nucleoside-diphosphate-sugar epimerase
MHIFLTGATGFIGKALLKDLLAHNHTVTALARTDVTAIALAAAGATPLIGDLTHIDIIRAGAAQADAVIHLAFGDALSDFKNANRIDRQAIQAMAEGLKAKGGALIIAMETLGAAAPGEVATETTIPRKDLPISERYEAEELVHRLTKDLGSRGVVVRLAAMAHGEGDRSFIPELTALARKNGRVVYTGDARWPAVYKDDAVTLFRLAAEKGRAGATYNAVAEQGVAVKDIVSLIGRKLGMPVEEVTLEKAESLLGFLAQFVVVDGVTSSERTRKELGWTPRGVGLLEDLERNYVW